MKTIILSFTLFCTWIPQALALDVGDISTFIYSNSDTVSKEIKNTTTTGRLITVDIEKISSPLDGGKVIPMESRDEILLTPASLLLPSQSTDVVRFFYKGPRDNKERYYRIVWSDQALSEAQQNNTKRSAIATASARIGTILVVAPRDVNYRFNYANNKLTNTGNATLRVVSYGPCLKPADGKECKENHYVMPGRDTLFKRVNVADKNGRVALWQADQFVPVK